MEIPECQEFPQRKKNKTPKTQPKKNMNFLFLQSRTNNKREKEASHRKREKTKGEKKTTTTTTNCRELNRTQKRNAKTFVKEDKVRERRRSSSGSGSLARPLAREGRQAGCAEREGGKRWSGEGRKLY